MAKNNREKNPDEGLGNLVVLMYAGNNCYTKVVGLGAEGTKGLKVDASRKTWSYFVSQYTKWINIPIGRTRGNVGHGHSDYSSGVIGVYDRTNLEHLDSMVSAACSAVEPTPGSFDEDS